MKFGVDGIFKGVCSGFFFNQCFLLNAILLAVDVLGLTSMKNIANYDYYCKLHTSKNQKNFERVRYFNLMCEVLFLQRRSFVLFQQRNNVVEYCGFALVFLIDFSSFNDFVITVGLCSQLA